MADKLTPQQEMAVTNRGGKLLVSAAAGSGKTKVLVDRLMKYLTDLEQPANLDEFLIITYTKAAAAELRGKIAAKLSEYIAKEPDNKHLQKQMQRLFLTNISTVHGFCTTLLREHAYRLDIPIDFRVADESECQELRETVLKDLLDKAYSDTEAFPDFMAFVDSQGVGRDDGKVPEIVQKVYDNSRCHLNPDGWLEECLKNADTAGFADAGETVWGRFLMEDLFSYLKEQIFLFQECRKAALEIPELKKVSENLNQTILQLEHLCASGSWDEVVQRKQLDFGKLTFPRKNPDVELAERIKAVRDACKEGTAKRLRHFANDSQQVLADLQQSREAANGLVQLVRQFSENYRQAKRSRRVLDFSDLEQKTLDLLLGKSRTVPTTAAREIGSRFREILVDEYQDSNGVQDAIFTALTEKRKNCFMVGDVKQSIYQFRLADPQIFLTKYNSYAFAETAKTGEGRKVLLSHNFRSGIEVIESVNDVFACCMSPKVGGLVYGDAEALHEGVVHANLPDAGVELAVLETSEDSYQEEAEYAVRRICRMISEKTMIREKDSFRPVTAEDIVILLRSPGSVGTVYQRALETAGIPCAMDGGMDLLQTEEISTLHSLLQTIANPRQDIPLLSTLASPLFCFTADDLAVLRGNHRDGCIFDALQASELAKCKSFLTILEQLRLEAKMSTLVQLLERCFTLTRIDSIYGAMSAGEARKSNLQMFFQMGADYEKNGIRSLGQFLEYLDSLQSSGLTAAGSSSAGCVRIMSIHKSKGLEFPVVFLCGLSRRFNQESLREQVLCHKELGLGLAVADNQNRVRYSTISKQAIAASMQAEAISEELRVLYVAMTRARDRLVMTYAAAKPANDLQDIALRVSFDGGALLCSEASCPGDWILTTALQRSEAGALHAVSGKPLNVRMAAHPWKIDYVKTQKSEEQASPAESSDQTVQSVPEEQLRKALQFQYAHIPAITAPSKQTATGRKIKQPENITEHTHSWRKPSFLAAKADAKAYGNATHHAMQFIRYTACTGSDAVQAEVERMVSEGLLSAEEGAMVDCSRIYAFFCTEIGKKLQSGAECLREFPFSILDDGRHYGDGLEGEQVLLQGVVDCAVLEPDGITVLDFKTDRIAPDSVSTAANRYRLQVETYAEALSRIFEMPIKQKLIYFFYINQSAEV